jgi:hypothetical protein
LVLACVQHAFAQDKRLKKTLPIDPGVVGSVMYDRAYDVAVAPESGAGGGTVPVSGGPSQPGALQAFRFEFTNSDHKIKRIALLRDDRTTQFAFGDNDGNDPFVASARYLPLTAEVCRVAIPASPDQVLLLAGFSLERFNTDYDVSELSILPYPDHGYIDVRFTRNLVGPGLAPETAGTVGATTIQYILAPRSRVNYYGFCFDGDPSCSRRLSPSEKHAIQAFRCAYAAGRRSAFLRNFAVSVSGSSPRFEFRDNNTDDAGACSVWFAGLR